MKLLFLFGEGSWKTSLRKGLNSIIFCGEENLVAAAPLYFCVRVEEVFMAFWDLNPLDILRQSPSITQLDHERGNNNQVIELWSPKEKGRSDVGNRQEAKELCYGEGWRSTHISQIFSTLKRQKAQWFIATNSSGKLFCYTPLALLLAAKKFLKKNHKNWQYT